MTRARLIFDYQGVTLFGSIDKQCRMQEKFALIINFNDNKKVTRYCVVQPNGMLNKKLLCSNV